MPRHLRAALLAAAFLALLSNAPRAWSREPLPPELVPVRRGLPGATSDVEVLQRVRDGALVVRIPGGPYAQRPYEPDGATDDPTPVDVETFLIDVHEVTNAQALRWLQAKYTTALPGEGPAMFSLGEGSPFVRDVVAGAPQKTYAWSLQPGTEELPCTALTGHGALAYAKWVGGRLPTKAEWEKAAGGPDGRIWPWGDTPPDATRARFGRPAVVGPVRVGSYVAGASPYGVLDMAGNVTERVSPEAGLPAAMIKGGSWLSPHPLNLRVLDMCMQPLGVAERSVGFRVVMNDRPVFVPTEEEAPRLHLETDWMDAVDRAERERKPLFLCLHYDTCGQCDRTRAQLFRDPQFIAYVNEHLVMVVGMHPGDAVRDPHPEGENGACPLLPGLDCWQHVTLFRQGLAVVESFRVSPGQFLLHPDKIRPGAGADCVLVGEDELSKWGNDVRGYLAAFRRAEAALAAWDAEHPQEPEASEEAEEPAPDEDTEER